MKRLVGLGKRGDAATELPLTDFTPTPAVDASSEASYTFTRNAEAGSGESSAQLGPYEGVDVVRPASQGSLSTLSTHGSVSTISIAPSLQPRPTSFRLPKCIRGKFHSDNAPVYATISEEEEAAVNQLNQSNQPSIDTLPTAPPRKIQILTALATQAKRRAKNRQLGVTLTSICLGLVLFLLLALGAEEALRHRQNREHHTSTPHITSSISILSTTSSIAPFTGSSLFNCSAQEYEESGVGTYCLCKFLHCPCAQEKVVICDPAEAKFFTSPNWNFPYCYSMVCNTTIQMSTVRGMGFNIKVTASEPPEQKRHPACQTCYDLFKNGQRTNGVYHSIQLWDPETRRVRSTSAYCDMQGGGYTVIQQRTGQETPFNQTWAAYETGFGLMGETNSFWWGLYDLHLLTTQCGPQALRIELGDCAGNRSYVDYHQLQVSDSHSNYRLSLDSDSVTGSAGDGLCRHGIPNAGCPDGIPFSTFDRQNDYAGDKDCSGKFGQGGWWYSNCANSQLHGLYKVGCPTSYPIRNGIYWLTWPGPVWSTDLAYTAMKIRPNRLEE